MSQITEPPILFTVSPNCALPGGVVTLRGQNLLTGERRGSRVAVGETLATVLFASPTLVSVQLPEATAIDRISLTTEHGTSELPFSLSTVLANNLHPVGNPALDAFGNIYTTFSGSRGQNVPHSLFRLNDEATLRPLPVSVTNPSGLAIDAAGNLYISSRFNGTVYRMSRDGRLSTYAEGMGVATGLAFDAEGNLYVGDRSGTIFKIAPDRQIFVFATLEPSIAAYHLAFAPDGNLYVTAPTTSSNDCVYQITPQGSVTPYFSNLGRPQGLAFDVDGTLYLAASWGGQRGAFRIHANRECELIVAASNLVGLALADSGSMILATTSAIYLQPWQAPGFVFLPELPEAPAQ